MIDTQQQYINLNIRGEISIIVVFASCLHLFCCLLSPRRRRDLVN
jgi:hypothetical protein